jgi:diguanylate cyclase (GGDEF)-like protein/PAS domain S-box-containing protein
MQSLIAISNPQNLMLWLQAFSEWVITLAYYLIPLSLAYYICLKICSKRHHITAEQQKEIEYQAFIKSSPNGFWCSDIKGRILDVNDALCRMLGYSEQELLTMNVMDIDAIESTEETIARIQHIMQTGYGCFETKHRRKDSSIIDVEINSLFLTALGSHFFVFVTDISQRKLAELEKIISEERLRRFYDLDLVGLSITSPEKGWISANSYLCNMLEYSEQELRQKNWVELSHPDDLAISFEFYNRLLANEINGYSLEKRFISRTGKIIFTRIVVSCTRKADGTVDAVNTMIKDITEYKRAETQLRIAAAIFESDEGVIITDTNNIIVNVNHAFTHITGYGSTDVIGRTPRFLHSEQHDKAFYDALWQTLQNTGTWQGEIWNRRKNGELYPKWIRITAVTDDDNTVTHYVANFTDMSERKNIEHTINQLEFYDPLTQLANSRLLSEQLTRAIYDSYQTGKPVALLMLNLDKFKVVNDNFGRATGDKVLQQVANRIKARLADADMVAHLGADEFMILLENVGHYETIARLAEALIHDLSQPFTLYQKHKASISTSIGIAFYPQHGDNAETLMDNVAIALYHAKSQGHGCFSYFSDELTQAARERLALEVRLWRAIEKQQLQVYFQAQIDIGSGKIIGAEALVRWIDPIHGFITPDKFIPIAEQTGQIIAIGEWVLRETCQLGRQWLNEGLPQITLAVNVSPYQFSHCDINALATQILNETGYPVYLLELEITESGLMENQQQAMAILNALHTQGVKLAIDDFGTGYSSLAYLKFFPLDVLKIDKSFIDDIPFLASDVAITSTIIAMAHHLGFKVLAEGVETQAQLDFLREQGCDMYQGYFYSKPIPAKDFAKLLGDSG